jgi:protein-tyrosine phosphatase
MCQVTEGGGGVTTPSLAELPNLRQVAGMTTPAGVPVRQGVLWRSDDPAGLGADDVAVLTGLDIGLVLDLRDEALLHRRPGHALADAGVERVWLPVAGWAPGSTLEGGAPVPGLDLAAEYVGYLEHGGPAFAEGLRRLATATRPVLVHCAAGKDRTGVLVALALLLVGVPEDAVVADYVVTQERMPALMALWRRRMSEVDGLMESLPRVLFEAEADTMRAFLRELETRFGGAAGWAARQGLTPDVVAALEDRLLEPSTRPTAANR